MKTLPIYTALLLFAAVLFLPLKGCAEATETDTDTENGTTDTNGSSEEFGSSFYFPLPDSEGDLIETEEMNFYVQTVAEGLGVPWGMAFLPSGEVLITQRDGNLRLIREAEVVSEPVGGVPEVWAQGQGGLLDIELHPNHEDNGWIYISYSKPGDGGAQTAVVRARFDADSHSLTDLEEIYEGTPFSSRRQHFGSRIGFDGDGYLFFSIGDRGAMDTAQDINSSNGTLIRLYDDGSIPEDNPFVGSEGLDEIYAYGLRNIQGLAVHPETGVVWTNLHGPRGGDELNYHDKPGANYGWPEITYGVNYNGTTITEHTEMEGMEQPVMHWTPSIAPSGMTFVSSDKYPGWQGDALNGALAYQLISRIVLDGTEYVHEERFLEGIGRIRDVHEAPDGYIYFTNESNGTLNRIVPAGE
ncbi:MAG: PQQ-dependent sugar dehydrogenase [Balneolaceae bacterium]|nr:PQQ-dependent sugar dehydrogenase [Balneolaceae bacterium]MCH8549971.1 PQQ-dependent sugar dehydrogenase [Balneolaceae bacterium]